MEGTPRDVSSDMPEKDELWRSPEPTTETINDIPPMSAWVTVGLIIIAIGTVFVLAVII